MSKAPDAPILAVRDLCAGYGQVNVLDHVSITVETGAITALIGANGAGKTTIMNAIAGLIDPTSGSVEIDGTECLGQPSHIRVARGLTLIPEGRMVFARMTVEENLTLGAITPGARADRSRRLADVYRRFPRLEERRSQLAGLMSGGEQQMLALGRGLMSGPRLILMDEPTLGLAPIMVTRIFETIEELRAAGFSILLAEQNARRALGIADHACVIENGKITITGKGQEMMDAPEVRRAYLGV